MTEKFTRPMQHERLLALADKLEISLSQLRRDDCGDWMLRGRFGRVYPLASSYQILISGWPENAAPWSTARGWNLCKADMSFATLTQDGDQEGTFMLERDPAPTEAEIIRHRVGLRKRRELDEEALAAMRDRGKALAARAKQEA